LPPRFENKITLVLKDVKT